MGEPTDLFVFDLANHAWSKCQAAIYDAIALVDDPLDKAKIAMLCLGNAAGLAGGAFAVAHGAGKSESDVKEWTLGAIDLAREVVQHGAEGLIAKNIKKRHPAARKAGRRDG